MNILAAIFAIVKFRCEISSNSYLPSQTLAAAKYTRANVQIRPYKYYRCCCCCCCYYYYYYYYYYYCYYY